MKKAYFFANKISKFILCSLLLFLVADKTFAQVHSIDSMVNVLRTTKSDTARCRTLYSIVSIKLNQSVYDSTLNQLYDLSKTKLDKEKKDGKLYIFYIDYLGRATSIIGLRQLMKENDATSALTKLDSALKIGIQFDLTVLKGEVYNNMGFVCNLTGDTKGALRNFLKGLDEFERSGLSSGMISLYGNIGDIYFKSGLLDSSLYYEEKGLAESIKINDQAGVARTHNSIGMILNRKGDVVQSVEKFLTGLLIAERIKAKEISGEIDNNLAGLYMNVGEIEKAEVHFLKFLKQAKFEKDDRQIATAYNNLGTLYFRKDDHNKAREYYLKSLSLREKIQDKRACAWSYQSLGQTELKLKNFEEALLYEEKALKLSKEVGDRYTEANANSIMSSILINQQKIDQAIPYGEIALKMGAELKIPVILREASLVLYQAYKIKGNFNKALEMHETIMSVTDSLNKKENKKAAIRSQFKYEFKQKESLLNEQRRSEQALASEKEKQQHIISISVTAGLLLSVLFSMILFNRLRITRKQKQIIEEQKQEVEVKNSIINEKQKEIIDSIHYAQRIQKAQMPNLNYLNKTLNRLKHTK